MAVPIDSAAQTTPEWLTQALYEAGVLKSGKVLYIESTANTAYHAQTTRLRVEYAGAGAKPPTHLFLKLLGDHKGKREIEVYRQLKTLPRYPTMTVPCYNAAYDSASGSSSLLLADVSETHHEVSSRDEVRAFTASPPLWQLESVVATLAHWHALGWEFEGTGHLPAARFDIYTDEKTYQGYVAHCHKSWLRFAEAEPMLAAENESLYLPLLEALPQLWQAYLARRFADSANLTLVHGDCYFSQFLCPTTHKGRTLLIDFDSVRLDTPTDDLAFLTTFWEREARVAHEARVLECYYHALCTAGIKTYPWEKFLEDYRFSIVQHTLYPILSWLNGDDERFWKPRLESITAAYKNWDCVELTAKIG